MTKYLAVVCKNTQSLVKKKKRFHSFTEMSKTIMSGNPIHQFTNSHIIKRIIRWILPQIHKDQPKNQKNSSLQMSTALIKWSTQKKSGHCTSLFNLIYFRNRSVLTFHGNFTAISVWKVVIYSEELKSRNIAVCRLKGNMIDQD